MAVKFQHITKRLDFENLFKRGKLATGKLVFLKTIKTEVNVPRFCVVVSSKTSKKAVARNKVKRQIRGIMKKFYLNLKPGFDIAIIAKKEILNKKYSEITIDIEETLKTTKAYRKND